MNAINFHSQIATEFDEKYTCSSDFKERFQVWAKIIDRYSRPDCRVLDLGCGSGVFTFYLAEKNFNVIGVDGSSEMIRICREKQTAGGIENVTFINCPISLLGDYVQEPVDVIVCSSVLEYLDDLPGCLQQISSYLNPDGLLLFSLPNKLSLLRRIEPISFQLFSRPTYYRFVKNVCTLEEVETLARNCGLDVIDSAYFGATPVLSALLRPAGCERYSDNLFVAVAQLIEGERPAQESLAPAFEPRTKQTA